MADRDLNAPASGPTAPFQQRWVDLGAGVYAPAAVSLLTPAESLVNDANLNDSDKTFTVPASTIWEPLFVYVELITEVGGGNRKMRLEIGDGTDLYWFKEWTPAQAASLTRHYFAGPSLPDDAAFDGADRARMELEPRFALDAGWTIRLFDVNAVDAAADDMTVRVLGDTRSG